MKLVKALFGVFCMVLLSSVAFAATDANCQKLAATKDKSAQIKAPEFAYTPILTNPCTGEVESADLYFESKYDGSYDFRYVFGSGDTYGLTGQAMYTLCNDGRARVRQVPAAWWNFYNNGVAWAWGYYAYFPMKSEYPWSKELCNTL